jgi:pyruvate,water dikinase
MNQEVKWVKYVTRYLTLYKLDVYLRGLRNALKKHFNLDYNNLLSYAKGQECALYIGEKDLKAFANLIKTHFLENIKANKDPFELLYRLQDTAVKTAIETGKRNISSKEELLKVYSDFLEKLSDLQIMIWFPAVCEVELFPYAQKRLMQLTSNEKAWDIIVEPFEPSLVQEEFIDLLKTAVDYSDEKLKAHQEKYAWMSVRFVDKKPYDLAYFKERLEEIENPEQELARIINDLNEKKRRFFELLDSLDLSREDRELFLAINKLNCLRNTRDKGRRRVYYYIMPLYDKILSVLDCDYNTFVAYTNEDIVEYLKNEAKLKSNPEFQEYIHLFRHGNFELIKDKTEERLEKEGIKSLGLEEVNEFKGSIANTGKATGKVKIITLNNWAEDIADVEKGDILVAISTESDYIVAMERAAAFVTDEGGITVHAAIVAREMGKPCIVGTEVATQVLKDGDMVEVDADNGVVRKIG